MFKDQLLAAPVDQPLVCSITTLGGDPEMARAMGDDIRLLRDYQGRETLFLGKVAVYSAGGDVHVRLSGREAIPDARHTADAARTADE